MMRFASHVGTSVLLLTASAAAGALDAQSNVRVKAGATGGVASGPTTAPVAEKGNIQGDIYVVLPNGDTKRGAGQTIYVLRDPDALTAALDASCAQWNTIVQPKYAEYRSWQAKLSNPKNAQEQRSAMDQVRLTGNELDSLRQSMQLTQDHIVASYIVDSTDANIDSHYIVGVPAEKIVLYSAWTIDRTPYHWWKVVQPRAGLLLTFDLNNKSLSQRPYCQIKR